MKEGKYIHYCWFGGKPLPKLAKKCLESWKKFLPEYELICWDEKNTNLDDCAFIREAYDSGAYAFVADYARTKALYEMGGIYFDTDMEIIKDPLCLIKENNSFLGVEDTGKVNSAVWYEKNAKSFLAGELLKKYKSFRHFDYENRMNYSIPLLMTEILEKCGFDYKKRRVQRLEHNITVFPREYFYPYSYNRNNNLFTDNTYMIHYYDASWLPVKSRIENGLVRKFGRIRAIKMIRAYQKTYVSVRKVARAILFPVTLYIHNKKKKINITQGYEERIGKTIAELNKYNGADYVAFHNSDWFGVTSATKELFDNCVDLGELYRKKDIGEIANAIVRNDIKQVIFSAMSIGGPALIRRIHRIAPGIIIKVYWHGSMSQVLDKYGWGMHKQIMKLSKEGTIMAFATCKGSLCEFYRKQGIKTFFITNKVEVPRKVSEYSSRGKVRVGLYAASPSNWRKNMYSQMAAVALIKNAVLDIVPLNKQAEDFAEKIGLKLDGVKENIERDELIRRMGKNDVNLYVTFSECAPMLPLESMEMGVPCLTGNNHHYFKESDLKKHLVVDQETDIELIKKKILNAIKNRAEIIKLFNEFSKKNLRQSLDGVKEFLEYGND